MTVGDRWSFGQSGVKLFKWLQHSRASKCLSPLRYQLSRPPAADDLCCPLLRKVKEMLYVKQTHENYCAQQDVKC